MQALFTYLEAKIIRIGLIQGWNIKLHPSEELPIFTVKLHSASSNVRITDTSLSVMTDLVSSPLSLSLLALQCPPWCPCRSCWLETSCIWLSLMSLKKKKSKAQSHSEAIGMWTTANCWVVRGFGVFSQRLWDTWRNVLQRQLILSQAFNSTPIRIFCPVNY